MFGTIDEIVQRTTDRNDAGCEYIFFGPTSDEPVRIPVQRPGSVVSPSRAGNFDRLFKSWVEGNSVKHALGRK